MATTFSNLLYHIVFSTKDRTPSIREDVQGPLYGYLGGILANEGGLLLEIGGMPDHVHLLVKLRTDRPVAEIVRLVKANSSRWMNREHPGADRFEWQAGVWRLLGEHVEGGCPAEVHPESGGASRQDAIPGGTD